MKRREAMTAVTAVGAAMLAGWRHTKPSHAPIPRVERGQVLRARDMNALIDRVNELTREIEQLRDGA